MGRERTAWWVYASRVFRGFKLESLGSPWGETLWWCRLCRSCSFEGLALRTVRVLSWQLRAAGEPPVIVSTEAWGLECHSVPQCSFPVISPRALFMLCKIRSLLSALITSTSRINQWHHFIEPERDLRYVGKILEGFSLASKPLSSKKVRKPLHYFPVLVLIMFILF